VRAGRQSIKLDNVRFIGNVELRQAMQVFNAVTVENTSLPNARLYAGYLMRQKTVFDRTAIREAIRASMPITITSHLAHNEKIFFCASTRRRFGPIKGCTDPRLRLAPNHLFEGWADLFLSTPRQGIRDTYVAAGAKLYKATLYGEFRPYRSDFGNIDDTGVENMRHAAAILMLLALPGSVLAALEFLTVEEIFQVIGFVAAHPAAPVNFVTVSPFGPEPDETRMPEAFADIAKSILHCYHHTARYRMADVAQIPWDREGQYSPSDNSALIRIRYFGATADDPYEMNVALVSRQAKLRTAVVNDTSPRLRNADCQLENWTTLKP
jgi:hypothetical protein